MFAGTAPPLPLWLPHPSRFSEGGLTCGSDAVRLGTFTDGGGTTLGPEGNNDSNPLPNARRFSAGLCSSATAMDALLLNMSYYDIFIFPVRVNHCHSGCSKFVRLPTNLQVEEPAFPDHST
jgi:hypothetical protein